MYDEFVEHINGLIYYGFSINKMEVILMILWNLLKEEIEKKINIHTVKETGIYHFAVSGICRLIDISAL